LTKGIGDTEFKDSPVGRIPVGWEITNLGSIVIPKGLQTGPFGSQLHAHEYVEWGVPVIMPKDMKGNRIDPNSIAHIPETRASQLDKHRVQQGELLFARRGDIGRFALVEKVNEGWVCGTGCLKARLSPSINPIFISCYLTLIPVIEWLNSNAVGQTMLNLNTSILADLPVILPPESEQKIIGDAISALDSSINSNFGKLASVVNIKKALMQDLLTGKVRVNVEQKESAVA
jgi:type I restriction enzyme S subunit